VVTTRWPRAQRCGGAVDASREEAQAWRGLWGERRGEEGQPPDKEMRRGLTQNSGAPVERWRRCGAVAFDDGGGTWWPTTCSDESCGWRGKGWVGRGLAGEEKGGAGGAHQEGDR
jgi:hypothetical protein